MTLRMLRVHLILCAGLLSSLPIPGYAAPPNHKTHNIIFVMTDGLRWQEVFNGADEALFSKENGVTEVEALKRDYWRPTAQERREVLMPFFWTTMARGGQVFGNRRLGSDAFVTNGLNFSYPGYNETLCGFPDSRINSNDKVLNPNVTMLEWLNRKPEYHNKIAAFGAWELFPYIFNAERAGFPVNASYEPLTPPLTPRIQFLNEIKAESPRVWDDEAFDYLPFHTALEYLKTVKPKVMYLSLGETDDWAHAGNYPEYLRATRRADHYLKMLWEAVQSMPEYRDSTTLVFSPDHGRGDDNESWKSHGEKLPESRYIWMAFLGPDTRAMGERSQIAPVTQNQIAATLAALLGEDYAAGTPKAGRPIVDVLQH